MALLKLFTLLPLTVVEVNYIFRCLSPRMTQIALLVGCFLMPRTVVITQNR